VDAKPGDKREEEMIPYLKRSANACVRFETRSDVKSELRNCIITSQGEEGEEVD